MREGGKEPREGEGRGSREGADNAGGLAPSKAYAVWMESRAAAAAAICEICREASSSSSRFNASQLLPIHGTNLCGLAWCADSLGVRSRSPQDDDAVGAMHSTTADFVTHQQQCICCQ